MRFQRRTSAVAAGAAVGLALGLGPAQAQASTSAPAAKGSGHGQGKGASGVDRSGTFDVNAGPQARSALAARGAAFAVANRARIDALRAQLGVQGLIDIDPLTGTPRQIARTDGFLTAASAKSPQTIVLDYVKAHQNLYGLDAAALATLKFRKDYVDVLGTHHLSWVQVIGGVQVFGHGLQGHVTKDGRLVSVVGSPLTDVAAPAAATLSAQQAGQRAVAGLAVDGAPAPVGTASQAEPVLYLTTGGLRPAYQTLVRLRGGELHQVVVDGVSGRVLYRHSLTQSDNIANVWENYPGATVGGRTHAVDLGKPGWISSTSSTLSGPNAHVFSDVNDDNAAQGAEEVQRRSKGKGWRFGFTPFARSLTPCVPAFPCSWDPAKANSWQTNRAQNAVQVFYYVNKFHDHLHVKPIGFTAAAGAFEGKDALSAQPDDGASTANGLPDGQHVDNANMSTPPDGQSPTMQMYLFHQPGAKFPDEDPFIAGNGGDEADVVYHEYTHGLSNRLVVDADGNSTLGSYQAGSMGEAWSDWYAFDYLANQGLVKDTAKAGDVRVGDYLTSGSTIRTEPLDCAVGDKSAACPGTKGAGRGGYTYGDFGKIIGGPEVHADGEIWAQTLWQLRSKVGSAVAETLVTRAMELSPANPSFLDERNAILQADRIAFAGKFSGTIWSVFASRGMGYYAGSVNGDDTAPVENFSLPPRSGTLRGTVRGTVLDTGTKKPLPGATVFFGGHRSGFMDDLVARTDSKGRYVINGIYAGTYPAFVAEKPGYDRQRFDRVTIGAKPKTVDFSVRRDWIALSGGASVTGATGEDYSVYGCGPAQLVDQQQGSAWVTNSADDAQHGVWTITPKTATYKLPAAVNVTSFAVDPNATCVGPSAAVKDYRIETSADGTTWTVAASGAFTPAAAGKLNPVAVAAGGAGVRYVRFVMIDNQVPGVFATTCSSPTAAYDGCFYLAASELEVFGTAAG